jgi:hypothetical protein
MHLYKIQNGGGNSNLLAFDIELRRCGFQCITSADVIGCVSSCMQLSPGYSAGCSNCIGELAQCTKQNCLLICLDPTKRAECESCAGKHCCADFVTCSGVDDSGLPNDYDEADVVKGSKTPAGRSESSLQQMDQLIGTSKDTGTDYTIQAPDISSFLRGSK